MLAVLVCGATAFAPAVHVAPAVARRSSTIRCADLPTGWREVTDEKGQTYYYNAASGVSQWQRPVERFGVAGESAVRSLSPECTWRINLELTSEDAFKPRPVSLSAVLRFAEEDGFEPPQGFVRVESCVPEGVLTLGQQPARWQLSEDPEDRGDSLWIWGLFSDPLYPYMLLELELEEPVEVGEGVSIPAGTLYCQVDHRRKDGKVQLGEGTVTYKVTESIKADLVGLSNVEYGEPVPCGKIRFLDTADDLQKSYV